MDTVPITKKLIAFGSKKIYLPKFTIAFIRTPRLSPYHARFLVPLDFSKYDLRDYLHHAYNVQAFNIRSFVKQMPVRDTRERPRHWFRPESKKYMTIEMDQPFVWPEQRDLAPWGKEERKKEINDIADAQGGRDKQQDRVAARRLRAQAEALLSKKTGVRDRVVAKKRGAGMALTSEDLRKEAEWRKQEDMVRSMSRLKLWEDKRTQKVVQSGDREKFAIKA